LNRSLSASAFTLGNDIFFRNGAYRPNTTGGNKLLAHELTHTMQQGAVKSNAQHPKFKPDGQLPNPMAEPHIQRTLVLDGQPIARPDELTPEQDKALDSMLQAEGILPSFKEQFIEELIEQTELFTLTLSQLEALVPAVWQFFTGAADPDVSMA